MSRIWAAVSRATRWPLTVIQGWPMGTATCTPSFSAQAVRLGLSQETVQPKVSNVRRKGTWVRPALSRKGAP